ncbi:hypothetical protein POM88_016108 [Heracleum sosnowskyi]|uniref:DUF4283 domain-containing protein n=1 Tax=Heracleum sosnowskyi TaxID=360622 RepID=A0AAD8MSM0_9APIA|nr:hypothetical protein POM88_016108 [Heracleum sosnowskyi]
MFEYTDAEVDEEVEKGLFQTKVALTKLENQADIVQNDIEKIGFGKIKVVGLSGRKFLLRSEEEEGWANMDIAELKEYFSIVRNFEEEDLFMPRTVWIECTGLPMNAWVEENLRAYTKKIGEWLSWTYQKDGKNEFFNPIICVSTNKVKLIDESVLISIKSKNLEINFREITDLNYLVGKIAPMEEEEDGEDEISRTSNEEIRGIDLGKIEMAKGSQVDKLTEQHDKEEVLSKDFLNNDLSGDVQAEGLNMAAKGDRDKDRFLDKMENKASRVRSRETSSDSYNISEDKNSDSRKSGDGSVSFDVDKGTESSEVSICNNLGSLKMGKRPGRPKKKKRVFKNPFDLGLNIKNEIGKGCKKKRAQGDKNSRADAKVEVVTKSAKESADEIISTAQLLGLELAGRREEAVLSVERKLKEGNL